MKRPQVLIRLSRANFNDYTIYLVLVYQSRPMFLTLWRSVVCTRSFPRTLPVPSRLFSYSQINAFASPNDPKTHDETESKKPKKRRTSLSSLKLTDPEKHQEILAKARLRYKLRCQDPEYDQNLKEKRRLKSILQRQDPEYAQKAKEKRDLKRQDPEYVQNYNDKRRLRYMLRRQDPEWVQQKNEKRRLREMLRRQDPEYVQNLKEKGQLYIQRRAQDPETGEQYLARRNERARAWYLRQMQDPEKLKIYKERRRLSLQQLDPEHKERWAAAKRKNVVERSSDPEYIKKRKEYYRKHTETSIERARKYYQEKGKFVSAANARGRFLSQLRRCCTEWAWVRDDLPWKTHKPVFCPERAVHVCGGCNIIKTHGLILWWQSLSNSEEFKCHNCYVPRSNWTEAMPTGYEDVSGMVQIRARKKDLEKQSQR